MVRYCVYIFVILILRLEILINRNCYLFDDLLNSGLLSDLDLNARVVLVLAITSDTTATGEAINSELELLMLAFRHTTEWSRKHAAAQVGCARVELLRLSLRDADSGADADHDR